MSLMYKGKENISLKSLQYLEYMRHEYGYDIQHAYQGQEKQIGPFFLDGYEKRSDGTTVGFEFDGCYFHHCGRCHTQPDERADEERQKLRKKFLKSKLTTLITRNECTWDKMIGKKMKDEEFAKNAKEHWAPEWCPFLFHNEKLRESDLLDALTKRKVFGFAKVDLEPTDGVLNRFGDLKFPMIFKKQIIERDMLNPNQRLGNLQFPVEQNTLVYRAQEFLAATPLLYFYMDMGYKITVKMKSKNPKNNLLFRKFIIFFFITRNNQ
jgi:hypothetical protein